MPISSKVPSLMVRLQVLAAIDHAPGNTIRDRIRGVSQRCFIDPETGHTHQFTWRTIETWRCRYNKYGVTQLDKKLDPININNAKSALLKWLRLSTRSCPH